MKEQIKNLLATCVTQVPRKYHAQAELNKVQGNTYLYGSYTGSVYVLEDIIAALSAIVNTDSPA